MTWDISLAAQDQAGQLLLCRLWIVFHCRVEMLQLYERCILMDIEFSDTQNVDQLLWKNAFYQVIEKFRQLLKDPQGENAQEIRNKLLQLLDEVRRNIPKLH